MNNKVSVIVPVYNVEKYLNRCLDSIIHQTYKNLEIILVNDGSLDNSGVICDEYADKDDRIIVIHQKNQGLSCARNSGLAIVSGDYIAYVDSDDYINITMFEKMMYYLIKHDLEVIEILPKLSYTEQSYDNSFIIENPVTATKRILNKTAFAVWRRIFKKQLVEDMRFIPGLIHQDVFYTMDMLKRIKRHGYIDSPLYYYNTDNESIIRSKYSLEKINTGIRATEYIVKNILKDPSLKPILNNYITHYYTDHLFLLSRNPYLDPDKNYRLNLRNTVRKTISISNISLRSVMVVTIPLRLMEVISSIIEKIKKN